MENNKSKVILRILFLLLISVLLIFALEFLARLFWGNPGTTQISISDPILNHKWRPNLEYTDIGRGVIPYTLYTNSQGFVGKKDISVKKPKDTIRIFYLGDSNVQGVVDEGKKMVNIVEQELNKKIDTKKHIEIINAGVSSYSPSIYYLELKTKILAFSPDIVVLNIDMTDARDDYIHYRNLSVFDKDGKLTAVRPTDEQKQSQYRLAPQGIVKLSPTEYNLQNTTEFLRNNSKLYYFTERLYYSVSKNKTLRKIFGKGEVSTTPIINDDNWLANNWNAEGKRNAEYSMFILGYTLDFLKEHNVKVIVTGVPHFPQYTGEWSARPHKIIEETAEKHEALHFNSYELLKNSIRNSEQTKYYWDVDPTHFNQAGNKIWADAHVRFLLDNKDKLFED